ncbi:MAG TPA: hypothetical protein ENK61_10110, partial [Devosia sp.]|nr:hypothetical protein [Devosia sp.]
MMNLSSLSKIVLFSLIAAGAAAGTLWLAYTGAAIETVMIAASVQIVAILLVLWNAFVAKNFVRKTGEVCKAVHQGDFDQRIIMPGAKGD